MTKEKTKFELRNVNDLIPYARNARTHSPEQIQRLASSIKEFGFVNPIIISNDGGVLAGHGRIMAAQKLGIKEVPCIVESYLTEAQKKAYILADNRLALDAGWDNEMLKIELNELKDLDFDLNLIGFDSEELKQFIDNEDLSSSFKENEEDDEKEIEIDDTKETISQPGDLWILGDHRVFCGDCTNPDNIKRLFGNDNPNLMVTDPPYGLNYDPTQLKLRRHSKGREGKINNDDRADWTDAYLLFKGNVAYIWLQALNIDLIMQNLRQCGFEIKSQIIWNKNHFVVCNADYQWKHEVCLYATKGNHNWKGGRGQSTVWDIKQTRWLGEGEWGHGTQKPIECMRRPIENNSDEGEFVYDPFLGSGTTLIAAERTKRKCLGCEIDPHYVDAIIRRWESETGGKAILDQDGAFFDDLDNE